MSNYTDSPFNVRVESSEASFYRIPRVKFWNFVKEKKELQDYVRDYYRNQLSESMESQQYMMMNGKKGAVCFHLQKLSSLFGVEQEDGVLIDFNITNEDIVGFCGISMRNSVNRILNELKREGVLDIRQQKIVILDNERIEEFIGRPVVENCLAGALHTKDAWQRFCSWAVPRNIFRGTAQAFATDSLALVLAQESLTQAQELPVIHRGFFYMPFMHSESLAIHEEALRLFDQPGLEKRLKYEKMHMDILQQFGLYPHRNAILGRPLTKEEEEYLKEHAEF